jgi:hypothetical protein
MCIFKNLFKKESPTIKFMSLSPEIAEIAPILDATTFRPAWMKAAAADYANAKAQPGFGTTKFLHTAKCPGIFNLYRTGWVMTAWQDITITTNGDGESFNWTTASDQKALTNGEQIGPNIEWHPAEQYTKYVGKEADTLTNLIKYVSPWRCVVPEGYYLMEMALPYSQEKRFTTVPGFYSKEYGVAQMNPQFKWHAMNSTELIKAGTPIAYYVLVPKDQGTMTSGPADAEMIQLDKTFKAQNSCTFITSIKRNKDFWSNLFKKK